MSEDALNLLTITTTTETTATKTQIKHSNYLRPETMQPQQFRVIYWTGNETKID